MALRDLGYKPYEGDRLPPSNNTWVLIRHALRRATRSWFVIGAAILSCFPPLGMLVIVGFQLWIARQMSAGPPEVAGQVQQVDVASWVRSTFDWQFWPFVTLITVGAGASVIARDRRFRNFQYYFSKPVTAGQYVLSHIAAVAVCVLAVTFIPAMLLVLESVLLAPPGMQGDHLGLLLPSLLYALIIAGVTSTVSVGVSALSSSRALTMSAWAMILLVPHLLGLFVNRVAEWPWLLLASIPKLLGTVGDALFLDETSTETQLEWFHATPVLALMVAASAYLAYDRVRRAEVIT